MERFNIKQLGSLLVCSSADTEERRANQQKKRMTVVRLQMVDQNMPLMLCVCCVLYVCVLMCVLMCVCKWENKVEKK